MKIALTNAELWQCLAEAEARKADSRLPLDVRVRSMETYALCLRAADQRGLDYSALRQAALKEVVA